MSTASHFSGTLVEIVNATSRSCSDATPPPRNTRQARGALSLKLFIPHSMSACENCARQPEAQHQSKQLTRVSQHEPCGAATPPGEPRRQPSSFRALWIFYKSGATQLNRTEAANRQGAITPDLTVRRSEPRRASMTPARTLVDLPLGARKAHRMSRHSTPKAARRKKFWFAPEQPRVLDDSVILDHATAGVSDPEGGFSACISCTFSLCALTQKVARTHAALTNFRVCRQRAWHLPCTYLQGE